MFSGENWWFKTIYGCYIAEDSDGTIDLALVTGGGSVSDISFKTIEVSGSDIYNVVAETKCN